MPGSSSSRIADRQRMQHGATGPHRMLAAGGQHAGDIALRHHRSDDIDRRRNEFAAGPAGGYRHDHRLQLHAGGALGDIHGLAYRLLGLGEIDHRAGLDAARERVTEA